MAESRQPNATRPTKLDRMTTTTVKDFELRPIGPDEADRLRADSAEAPVYIADSPTYPCRQCLQDAEIGDELLLVSYDPFRIDSPYRSASPIFLHREPCPSPDDRRTLPRQLTSRLLSVRSFDERALMLDAAVVPGDQLEQTLNRFFEDDGCDHVHVHNASPGCWAVRVERAV
jgi:hypothetical protein